jgi:hypothetical protein
VGSPFAAPPADSGLTVAVGRDKSPGTIDQSAVGSSGG